MNGLLAIVGRDIRLALRGGADALTLVLFFVMAGAIVPFAIGPDRILLQKLAPGLVWIAAFLAMLLGLDRLFRADEDDGTLLLFRHAAIPLEAVVGGKMLAHWLLTALPVLAASPLLALLLSMDMAGWTRTALSLLLGTPALAAFGTVGAAVTVSLRRGGLLAPVLVLPLSIPVLIFGAGAAAAAQGGTAATLFLAAISLVSVAFCPFAAALALRVGSE
ncbi:MAG TPA: heme exporter protein CcmB [Devosia sp.]|nr:heme exporter protein CcmB [Devosia sp.]